MPPGTETASLADDIAVGNRLKSFYSYSRCHHKQVSFQPMGLYQHQVALLVPGVRVLRFLVNQKQFCLSKMRLYSSWLSTAI